MLEVVCVKPYGAKRNRPEQTKFLPTPFLKS
jgi:hypothetical protein